MDLAGYQSLIRESAEDCRTIDDLAEFLAAVLSWGTIIDRGPDGRERVTFGRVLVARIDGLRIEIRPREHAPPHFHVVAHGVNARFEIVSGEYLGGDAPRGVVRQIQLWHGGAVDRLVAIWNETRPSDCPVGPIVVTARQ